MKLSKFFWIGVVFLITLVLFAVFGPSFRHPYGDILGNPHQPMSWEFWCGTDEQGRDVFSRLAAGARYSLCIGLFVQSIALSIGVLMGVLAVYAHRFVGQVIMRLTDAMFAFPDLIFAFLIIGIWDGPTSSDGWFSMNDGVLPVIVALSISAWPGTTRLVRSLLVSLKDQEFIVATRALGAPTVYVILRHALPQMVPLLLTDSMIDLARTIMAESTLNFLGIGIKPPEPSWGIMINNARQDMNSHPIQLFWPCMILSATIFSLNFVGDGLRSLLDPRNRVTYDKK